MSKKDIKYYLGLDIGTNSVGWAVTDKNYNLLRAKGKDLWGVRLFDEASTAAERRGFRSSRRRNARKKERIKLLQEMFAEEIYKVDPAFFERIKDSKFLKEDKTDKECIFSLFNDEGFTDREYHEKYPTIYHLRKELIESNEKHDIRLIYLAIAHIIKNRGHFLFGDKNIESVKNFDEAKDSFKSGLNDLEITVNILDEEKLENLIKTKNMTKKDKSAEIFNIISIKYENKIDLKLDEGKIKEVIKLITGQKANLKKLFDDESIIDESDKVISITFDGDKYEEEIGKYESILSDEKIGILNKFKRVYDWSILANILDGEENISDAKVKIYEKHKCDLKDLKKIVKQYIPEVEKEIFDIPGKENYVAYTGYCIKNKRKVYVKDSCTQEEFCDYLNKKLKNIENNDDEVLCRIKEEISSDKYSFMPKQVSKKNSVIPYQLNLAELEKILKNASKHYDFLNEKDSKGYVTREKIEKLLTFRIPYYVGPLNDRHKESGFCWIEKKSNEKIYPWNFDEIVDKEASAEKFIMRMTNKCTYLLGEDVLPDQSILYSKFKVLNELNNLKINGVKPPVETKKKIFKELFLRETKITEKKIKTFFKREYGEDIKISGIDGDFKNNMSSYIKLSKIIDDIDNNMDMVENIILWSTVLGSEKKMLKKKISKEYGSCLSENKINNIVNIQFSGWGRLSRKLLTEIKSNIDGNENIGIIDAMYNTNYNLMQLLSNEFSYKEEIESINRKINESKEIENIDYERIMEDLYVSPAVKRSIWQTVLIVEEIKEVLGCDPEKIFVEMTRKDGEKKRTVSRKKDIEDKLKKCKESEHEYIKEFKSREMSRLDSLDESQLRSKKLYLYYTQMGRDMYTGEVIEFSELIKSNNKYYDIDHIYPRSKTKDDSIIKNLVLTNSQSNKDKGDKYPISPSIQNKMAPFWKILKDKDLISKEKYNRLMRKDELTENELASFIERQLVFTAQSTKAVTNILQRIMKNSQIVYAKAENTSDFRKEIIDFVKVREVNDYHHAHDAYLAIVVGNVYDVKFTRNALKFIKSGKEYSLKDKVLYSREIKSEDGVAWIPGDDGTKKTVMKVLNKNSILVTKHSYCSKGKLFKQNIVSKNEIKSPENYIRIKNDDRLDVTKYGGYSDKEISYFIMIEHTLKNRRVRTIESIPKYLVNIYKDKDEIIKVYLREAEIQYKDMTIIEKEIKKNSLFEINGYKMYINSKTGNQIYFSNANQLKLDNSNSQYIKLIAKCINNEIENSAILNSLGVTKERNNEIFMLFKEKMKNTVYNKRPVINSVYESMENGLNKFSNLEEYNQIKQLMNILKVFRITFEKIDTKMIGGSANSGILKRSKNFTSEDRVILINQSPTGIYERRINLLSDELANSCNKK